VPAKWLHALEQTQGKPATMSTSHLLISKVDVETGHFLERLC